MNQFSPFDLFLIGQAPMNSFLELFFNGADHDGRPVAEDVRKIAHPEVHVLIPVLIPYFGALCLLDKERVGRKEMNVVRNPSGHDLFRSFEEVFREACLLPVYIRVMFHAFDSYNFRF